MRAPLRIALLAAVAVLAGPAVAGDPAQDMKSADVSVRLAAVDALGAQRTPESEAALVDALKDADWEVIERAATALGERGAGPDAAKAVAKVALDAPARRTRILAARALAKLPGWADASEALTRVRPDDYARALDSVAAVGWTRESEALAKFVERGLSARKDEWAQAAAAGAIGVFPTADRVRRLRELTASPDAAVSAAAVDAVRAKPDDAYVPVLLEILSRPKTFECTARRARLALVEAAARKAKGDEAAKVATAVADALKQATPSAGAWQLARTLGEMGEIPEEHVPRGVLLDGLGAALANATPSVRAAAAWGLGRIGGDPAANRATDLAKTDPDPHVRLVALQSLARLRTPETDSVFRLCCDRVKDDPDPRVREEAAVQLGRKGLAATLSTLRIPVEKTMADKKCPDWEVAVAALVSLGKTRQEDVVPFLIDTALEAKDWKIRAAALVGLGHVQDKRAIPVLIDALGAKETLYHNVASEFLKRANPDGAKWKDGEWKPWWAKAGADFRFVDREEENRKAKKYGYAPDPTGVYEGLDVVVFQSEDKIENLLTELGIEYRITRSAQIQKDGLHPFAVFVVNCTGEIDRKDVEPVSWFVHAGGYLFGSCWALHETIEKACPGCVRKYDLKGQVIENVVAHPCRPGSPFVEGVFRPFVRPIYVLWGSHLIDVTDPERAEVLMDSPVAEKHFGNGNLVAWFPMGHGLVLDSTNHFERQGVGKATDARTTTARMAYAVDHLGLTYPELRKVSRSAWDHPQDADKEAKDLSSFRFITNFVRQKRMSQE